MLRVTVVGSQNPVIFKGQALLQEGYQVYRDMQSSVITRDLKAYLTKSTKTGVFCESDNPLYKFIIDIEGFKDHVNLEFPEEQDPMNICLTGFHVFLAMRYARITNRENLLIAIYARIIDMVPQNEKYMHTFDL